VAILRVRDFINCTWLCCLYIAILSVRGFIDLRRYVVCT